MIRALQSQPIFWSAITDDLVALLYMTASEERKVIRFVSI
jgi:hypothetical protein